MCQTRPEVQYTTLLLRARFLSKCAVVSHPYVGVFARGRGRGAVGGTNLEESTANKQSPPPALFLEWGIHSSRF